MGYIYKIVNDINDKVYIGQTKGSIKDRWAQHLYNAKNNITDYYIYRAMRKYGIEKFHIVEIEKCPNDELNNKEIYYIEKFNSFAPFGYNLTRGGDGNSQYNYQDVIKWYYECDENISKTQREHNISYDTIKRALDSQNISPHSCYDFLKTPIYECDIDNNIIKSFSCYQEVIDYYPDLHLTKDDLCNFLATPRTNKIRGKYFCKQSEYEFYKKENHHNACYVSIKCLETGEIFESISSAARWVKEQKPEIKGTVPTIITNISKAIKNNWKSYGYTWVNV